MKATLACALLAALGLIAAGCGSGNKVVSGPITVVGTTTVSNMADDALVMCKGGVPSAKVPARGHGVAAAVDGVGSSSSATLQVNRDADGTVVASCHRSRRKHN